MKDKSLLSSRRNNSKQTKKSGILNTLKHVEENTYEGSLSKHSNNKLSDYPKGIILNLNRKKNEFPITIEITGNGTAEIIHFVEESAKFWQGNIGLPLYHNLFCKLMENRADEIGDVELLQSEDNEDHFLVIYAVKVKDKTIKEAVEFSDRVAQQIKRPLDDQMSEVETFVTKALGLN